MNRKRKVNVPVDELRNFLGDLVTEEADIVAEIGPQLRDLEETRRQIQRVTEIMRHAGLEPVEATLPTHLRSWTDICNQHGWVVGTNSAHRIVRREDPALHRRVPHHCVYDDMQYPNEEVRE